ncbi:4-hydroxy-tetrahydrodipicolinate synthase [Blastococcus sp. TF02A-26]|uniref:4-hydroxy-tetrahydrodipicolinate synthase n=1 Tax=Blastococcus sp. TF02A-26 TaxID=2250577 RepID=UPI000DE868FB|nr:4-hydroxy-tetrahydrodipicolinate synthase [Blastococcus sp. TF02A-26]RBY89755.1 4-hydroxy-tetrahydrodipicolinate synthase [Blastococcus sp. TF02A-26]
MIRFGPVLTAIVTPFDERGDVDEEAFVALLRHVCATGSDGVVVAGSTGEAATLSDSEHLRVIELAVREKPEGAQVIAGTGSNDTRHACELTAKATELGVDGVLSVTPYYNKPNRRGLLAHYAEVARSTDKPVLLYNIPSRSVIDVPNDLLAEIAQLADNIVGVKQANDDNLAPIEGLDLYAGNDDSFARALDAGAVGGILVASHVLGSEMRRMVTEPEERAGIDASLRDVYAALAVTTNPIGIKRALALLGHCSARLRLPLVEADEQETAVVRAMLERHGLLEVARG